MRTAAALYLAEALTRNELYTQTQEKDTEARLTDLFRTARLSFEEGGANVLFLCLGFLKWQPQDGVGPYRAPLVLVPVQLERKSVRSGFRLALHEDEIRFNPTLLQMLRRDFELRVPELDDDLPANGSGVDIARIWKILRENVKGVRGFEVTEQVVLTTLSFSKYLLWKDLVDRTDQLKENPVVKHLIDAPTHSYGRWRGRLRQPVDTRLRGRSLGSLHATLGQLIPGFGDCRSTAPPGFRSVRAARDG